MIFIINYGIDLMKKTFSIAPLSLLVVLILGTTLTACSPAPSDQKMATNPQEEATPVVVEQSESERLTAFFENSFEQDLKRSPMFQSRLGIKWDYGKWNNVSVAFTEESRSLRAAMLEQAQSFNLSQLNPSQKLSLELYITDIERKLANDEFPYHT